MVKLRYTGSSPVSVYRPEPEGTLVKPGEVIEVPGVVLTPARVKRFNTDAVKAAKERDQPPPEEFVLPEDAVVVEGEDGDLRAFATSAWQLVDDKASQKDGS